MSNAPMTKDDLIWVVIRGAGFVLSLRAALYIPQIVGTVAWLVYLGDFSFANSEGHRMSVAMPQLLSEIVLCVFDGGLGFYLLRSAAWVHRLISFVGRERSNSAPHRDGREASHLAEPSSAPARERER